jgi:hypothetical protein
MNDIKKLMDLFSKSLPIVYVFGYIIVSGYLSNYGFSDFSILNVTYLKAGMIFYLFVLCIVILVYFSHNKETLTDVLELSWPGHLTAILYLLLFASLSTLLFVDYSSLYKENKTLMILSNVCSFLMGIYALYSSGLKSKKSL